MPQFDELSQFDRDFKPEVRNRPGLEAIPDGDHDFEISSATLERTEKTSELILRVGLKVLGTGAVVENAYFFRTQQNVDILGSDLCTLGIDADAWHPPARPFSQELPLAVPKLPGRRFRGKKVTKPNAKDPAKPHHNLYVNQLLGNTPTPAAYSPPTGEAQRPVTHGPAATAEDIPF